MCILGQHLLCWDPKHSLGQGAARRQSHLSQLTPFPPITPSCGHKPLTLKETLLDCFLPLPVTLIFNFPFYPPPPFPFLQSPARYPHLFSPLVPGLTTSDLTSGYPPPLPQAASPTDFLLARSSDLVLARDSESEGLGRSSVTHQLRDSEQTEALL